MLSTADYLHLVFDYENDIHYTDTLLALNPDAYLWYMLKQQDHFDVIVFVKQSSTGIRLQTMDTFSEQALLLKREGLFRSLFQGQKQITPRQIAYSEFTIQKLGTSDGEFLKWIQERMNLKELKGQSFAFVFQYDAFETVFSCSPEQTQQALCSKINHPDGKSVLILQLSPHPEQLHKAFLKQDALLPRLHRNARAAVTGNKEPLANALDRHMECQIHKLHLPQDIRNILLYRKILMGDDYGSVQDMEDQAVYLQESMIRYSRFLAADPEPIPNIRRKDILKKLEEPQFRVNLRRQTQVLKNLSKLSIQEAIQTTTSADPVSWLTAAEDVMTLIKNIQALDLPGEPKWNNLSGSIIGNLQPLWNQPLCQEALRQAIVFGNAAWNSVQRKDWTSAWEALTLLDFFAKQICASPEQESSLSVIAKQGKLLLDLSFNLFKDSMIHPQDDLAGLLTGYNAIQLSQEKELANKIAEFKNQETLYNWFLLRSAVQQSMKEFSARPISEDVMREILDSQTASIRRNVESIAQVRKKTVSSPVATTVEPAAFRKTPNFQQCQDDFDEEDLAYMDELERGRLAGEHLLKSTGLG